VLTGEQLSESGIKKEGSDDAEPSWKDRSGRLTGTALSLTSSRESLGNLPKRRTPFLGWARILRRKLFVFLLRITYVMVIARSYLCLCASSVCRVDCARAWRLNQALDYLGHLRQRFRLTQERVRSGSSCFCLCFR